MDATTMIDNQLEAAREKLYQMERALKRLEHEAEALYEKKLDLIVAGKPDAQINELLSKEWEKILSSVFAMANGTE
jgi:hypothetical protein